MEYPTSEIDSVKAKATHLFTHRHPDHYSKKLVRKLTGNVYGPWKVKRKRRADLTAPAYSAAQFTVETFRTKHRFAHHHYSYLITWHGKRIYLSGDAESPETIARMDNMDLAFTIKSDRFAVYHLYPKDKVTSDNPKIQLLFTQGEVLTVPY
jgi:L-ascorbate metabolism protein UlaG (beta-lactamase superfamily)